MNENGFDGPSILVLDHGYVKLIETWGSDERIIEAARMSTNKGFLGWGNSEKPGDEKLLNYLWTHKHATPFEMAGMIIEVQAPIFVFREWHRHRTQSYNEMSARYIPMPDEHFLPTPERCLIVNGTNKQAGKASDNQLTHEQALQWLSELSELYMTSQQVYERGLLIGIPKEIARCAVTVSRYSKMRASTNLRNWLAFLTLRRDPAAQIEIQEYANVVGKLIEKAFPKTWEIYVRDLEANK